MAIRVKKGPNGTSVLHTAQQFNPIAREEQDNTMDLEKKAFAAQSKRKWNAPDISTPGRKVSAPPHTESTLPG